MLPAALPLLRFDPRYERKWFHQFQHIYMWALYPFLQIVFQINDIKVNPSWYSESQLSAPLSATPSSVPVHLST